MLARDTTVLSLLSGEPVKLRFTGEIGEFLVEQGKKFSISFECVDADGKLASLGKFQSYTLTHIYSDTTHKKL